QRSCQRPAPEGAQDPSARAVENACAARHQHAAPLYHGPVSWAFAFAVTLVCELPVYVVALRRPLGGVGRALVVGAALNLATHPLAWMLAVGHVLPFLGIEGAVLVAEAALLFVAARGLGKRLPFRESLLVSLAANAFSAGVGLLVL